MQLVPFPAMKPLQPSSLHIFASAFGTLILYSFRPTLCTWKRIFNRSRGETTVRETAPATPPAMKEATTGCWKKARRFSLPLSTTAGFGGNVSEADHSRATLRARVRTYSARPLRARRRAHFRTVPRSVTLSNTLRPTQSHLHTCRNIRRVDCSEWPNHRVSAGGWSLAFGS